MPIYEYQCGSCNHEFEALQKMSDAPLAECPECHKESLKKKISASGFRLSGSGWYETDFKKSGNKKNLVGGADKSSGDAAAASGGVSQSGGETKNGGETKKSESKPSPSSTD